MSSQPDSPRVPEWTIAERLYLARTVAGYEKQQLADAIGVSRDTVGNYESRSWARKRSPAYIKAWALATGVDGQWLQTGISPIHPSGVSQRGNTTGSIAHEASIHLIRTAA
jgi:transcriptional regulator with XRE-family HTH domain